jgi:hypothetical protein
MSAHEIQALIDEYKEELSDDLYLKLSNLNMKKKENTKTFYKALYIIPTIFDINDDECEYKLGLKSELRIIEMSDKEYEELNNKIINTFNSYQLFCQLEKGERYYTKRMIGSYYDNEEDEKKYSTTTICYTQKEYLIKLEKIE